MSAMTQAYAGVDRDRYSPGAEVLLPSPSASAGMPSAGPFLARTTPSHRPGTAGPVARALTGPVFSTGHEGPMAPSPDGEPIYGNPDGPLGNGGGVLSGSSRDVTCADSI